MFLYSISKHSSSGGVDGSCWREEFHSWTCVVSNKDPEVLHLWADSLPQTAVTPNKSFAWAQKNIKFYLLQLQELINSAQIIIKNKQINMLLAFEEWNSSTESLSVLTFFLALIIMMTVAYSLGQKVLFGC